MNFLRQFLFSSSKKKEQLTKKKLKTEGRTPRARRKVSCSGWSISSYVEIKPNLSEQLRSDTVLLYFGMQFVYVVSHGKHGLK